jgi:hypothetical protein
LTQVAKWSLDSRGYQLSFVEISISILEGKRKPGGISMEKGERTAENRPGRDWTGGKG